MSLPPGARIRGLLQDLLYPPRCPLCAELSAQRDRPCEACGARLIPLPGEALLDLPSKVWLSRAIACFAHEEPLRKALHRFKFQGAGELIRFFAAAVQQRLEPLGPRGFEVIAAVPMSGSRIRLRGFNPPALLARRLGRLTGAAAEGGLLTRARAIPPQVGLPREERLHNVRGAFSVRPAQAGAVEGRRVLLLDDVMTTGATANDCARALMEAGATEVIAATVARAL